jgi:hypothetical protein
LGTLIYKSSQTVINVLRGLILGLYDRAVGHFTYRQGGSQMWDPCP